MRYTSQQFKIEINPYHPMEIYCKYPMNLKNIQFKLSLLQNFQRKLTLSLYFFDTKRVMQNETQLNFFEYVKEKKDSLKR